jgi:ABC-type multidrug transport system permease subunit
MVLIPFQLVDVAIFGTITCWSVGLTASGQGLNFAELIRLVCSLVVTETLASPLVGILLMFMVLVCGNVIPKNIVPVWLLWLRALVEPVLVGDECPHHQRVSCNRL